LIGATSYVSSKSRSWLRYSFKNRLAVARSACGNPAAWRFGKIWQRPELGLCGRHVDSFANAESHRRVLRDREGHSRPQCRGALFHSTTERLALADAFQKWLGIAGVRQRVAVQRGILRQRPSQVCDTNIQGDSATALRSGMRAVTTVFGHSDDLNIFLSRSCTLTDNCAKQKQREHNQPT
jgi:hypothetical protein